MSTELNDLTKTLAEIKRVSTLIANVIPKKTAPVQADFDMIRGQLLKLQPLISTAIDITNGPLPELDPLDEQVVSSLVHLGLDKPRAQASVKKAMAQPGACKDFDTLFIAALHA